MKAFIIACLTLSTFMTYAQINPGLLSEQGNPIYSEGGIDTLGNGNLKLITVDDFLEGQVLLLDGFDIQTTYLDSTRCGTLYIQDGGGDVSLFGGDNTSVLSVNGNVEIRDSLAFDGNSSQVQTRASGQIAFGTIDTDGTIHSGSDNISVSYNGGAQRYEIAIENENYVDTAYSTTVTAVGVAPLIPTVESGSNMLYINLFNLSGIKTTGKFSFVVNKFVEHNGFNGSLCDEGGGGPLMLSRGKSYRKKF